MSESARHPSYKPELRQQAADLYAEVRSVRKVAAAMGLSVGRAHQLLREAGVELRPVGDHDAR